MNHHTPVLSISNPPAAPSHSQDGGIELSPLEIPTSKTTSGCDEDEDSNSNEDWHDALSVYEPAPTNQGWLGEHENTESYLQLLRAANRLGEHEDTESYLRHLQLFSAVYGLREQDYAELYFRRLLEESRLAETTRFGENEGAGLIHWQRLKRFMRGVEKIFSILVFIIGVLSFVVNDLPTLKGAEMSELATNLAAWEAAKDLQSICQSNQVRSCQVLLCFRGASLPPPLSSNDFKGQSINLIL